MKNKNQIKLPIEEVPLKIKETKKIAKQAMIIEEKPIKTKAFKQKILLQKNKKDKIKVNQIKLNNFLLFFLIYLKLQSP